MNEGEYINEICALRARLDEVEAERDRYRLAWFSARGGRLSVVGELHGLMYDNERLRARLAAVEAERDRSVECSSCAACAACDGSCGVCPYADQTKHQHNEEVRAAARGEGDRPDSLGSEVCWDCCKSMDHARHVARGKGEQ